MPPELELRDIVKHFPGVLANDHISLSVDKGEIRALVGENGAGKTTLMRILYGLYQPDAGEIYLRGQRVRFHSPYDAIRAGLGMVHQHFMLFPSLTVCDNVMYGAEVTRRGFLDRAAASRRVADLSAQYGLTLDPEATVGQLPVGMRQRVEIVKTLYRSADLLVLDEPTAVLTPQEEDDLFAVLRRLACGGKTIIFITHKLDEVMRISDRATVLRHGAVVTTVPTAETSPAELSRAMVGRGVVLTVDKPPRAAGPVTLSVQDLQVLDDRGHLAVRSVSFDVCQGEIVGIAGVAGNGQNELVEALTGLRRPSAGQVSLKGRDVTTAPVGERREAGLAYIPEDRGRVGLALAARLDENLLAGYQRQPRFDRRFWLDFRAVRRHAEQLIHEYDVRGTGPRQPMANLSGGNRQKAIIARELSHQAPLLIAEQPTWGVDVGSIEFIHAQLLECRQRGQAVLLVSAELSEIMALADRILVMYEGRLVGEVPGAAADKQELGLLMTGAGRPST